MIVLTNKKYKAITTGISSNTQELESYRKSNRELQVQLSELSTSILYWTEQAQSFRGNKYNTYEEQISQANIMFNGTADWGVNQIGAVIESRVGFIIPRGFKVVPKIKGAEAELAFAQKFIEFNGLAKENIYHFVTEGELEGKILLKLFYDSETEFTPEGDNKPIKGMTSVRYLSQVSNPYSVTVKGNDYMLIEKAVYKDANGNENTLLEPVLVYRKFGGRLDKINETSSKILKVLSQIENLDRALRDLREINHLFATPIPDCETGSAEDAVNMQTAMDKSNWKPGKMFFHTGKFGFAQPSAAGVEMLYKEIVILAEMISFNTGVPVHYWFPELATNRATAEDISFGLINSATSRERNIWEGLLEEMINKAIVIYNENSKMTPLRQGLLKVKIPVITEKDWERLQNFWTSLWQQKGITLKTLLGMIPEELDVDKEIAELEKAKDEAFEKMKTTGIFDSGNKDNEEDEKDVGDQKEKNLLPKK